MNKEILSIIRNLENTLDGTPWFGRPVYALLREASPEIAFKKPTANAHSLIELLYHMLNWAEFTLKRLERDNNQNAVEFEKSDWRDINPETDNWFEILTSFISVHRQIIALLHTKEDDFLKEQVDHREYNFRFLLNGLIQHNIYHAGQVASLVKQLS